MQEMSWIIAALFLPLFPLGMIFNTLFQKAGNAWLRAIIILLWPLPGIWLLQNFAPTIPDWVVYWAIASSILYAFRSVAVKEIGIWVGFIATSAWCLVWIAVSDGVTLEELLAHVIAFSLPLTLLALLVGDIQKRFDSAYAGIVCGLGLTHPRLSGMFVITILAIIASPIFPAFFSMIALVVQTITNHPGIALGLALVWLLWSWSGMRLIQELLVGADTQGQSVDIGQGAVFVYGLFLLLLSIGGFYMSRIVI